MSRCFGELPVSVLRARCEADGAGICWQMPTQQSSQVRSLPSSKYLIAARIYHCG